MRPLALYFTDVGQAQARLARHDKQHGMGRVSRQTHLVQPLPDTHAMGGRIHRRALLADCLGASLGRLEPRPLQAGAMILYWVSQVHVDCSLVCRTALTRTSARIGQFDSAPASSVR